MSSLTRRMQRRRTIQKLGSKMGVRNSKANDLLVRKAREKRRIDRGVK